MGSRKQDLFRPLEEILESARLAKTEKVAGFGGSLHLNKTVLKFAQQHKVIKYREMRELLKLITSLKEKEKTFIETSEKNLGFSPENWVFFSLWGERGWNPPKLIPEIFDSIEGLKPKKQEITDLIEKNEEVKKAYIDFDSTLAKSEQKSAVIYRWIHEQFRNNTIESKIESFLDKEKSKTRMSKALISSLMSPSNSQIIKTEGELPDLSVGEREAFQFLAWKLYNMSEKELHIRDNWILDGKKEDSKKTGYLVVFEQTEALEKNFGKNIEFSGPHYRKLREDLKSLLEKKRRILLHKQGETLELSLNFLQKLEMRHKYADDLEYRNYIAVWLPYELVRLHDKLYTAYPNDHFAQLRHTPPKSQLDKPEVRFFDFIYNEAPHKKNDYKIVRRNKKQFIEFIGGESVIKNRNGPRVGEKIEKIYSQKAKNLNVLKDFSVETNREGEEIYVFEYHEKRE